MPENFDDVLEIISSLGEKLRGNPRSNEILKALTEGKLNPEQAVEVLFRIVREEGSLEEYVEAAQLVQVSNTGVSPHLLEAALIERVSLDGDVPELRQGPLPPEGKPAVPVLLQECLDPVVVGMMLERASSEVSAELTQAQRDYNKQISEQAEKDPTMALQIIENALPGIPTGVPGYLAGHKPQLRVIPQPSGAEVLSLTEDKARLYSFRALGTTQGRVSLALPIQTKLTEELRGQGLRVTGGRVKIPLAEARWVVDAYGARDFSPNFNFVETALAALQKELLSSEISLNNDLYLEVTPFNGVSTRTFGWQARIGKGD